MNNCVKINIENTINSGQVFLWEKYNESWYGINGQDVLKVDHDGGIISYSKKKIDFFRNNDNQEEIIRSISKDELIKTAVKKYLGLRVMRQDPFQCLVSFIVSSNSNIPKIKFSLEKICKKFGKKIQFDQMNFNLFPDPKKIASLTIAEIGQCGVGYRGKFIKEAAEMIIKNQIDLESLKKSGYQEAKTKIMEIPGVGNKVADCVLLFSLEKLDAFPLDRWMIRTLQKNYFDKFELKTKSITEKQYNLLHEAIFKYFGPYAGYAQQFLFKMERENFRAKWL